TQAIAQEVKIGGTHNINVTGRVIQEALTCNLKAIVPIQLADTYTNSIDKAPEKTFSIGFSGCNNQANNRNVKVVIAKQDNSYLTNTGQTKTDTNARVALLDSQGVAVILNSNDSSFRTFTSDVAGESGDIQFSLKYMAPDVGTPVTPGAFSSSLSFDAYVTDDVE
ncbi:TPA: type 1 fimbrial protein, partial [Proteus mirabilis]|nr:type 1 fimbrial protein [Proteus mirabilis]